MKITWKQLIDSFKELSHYKIEYENADEASLSLVEDFDEEGNDEEYIEDDIYNHQFFEKDNKEIEISNHITLKETEGQILKIYFYETVSVDLEDYFK
jgi:DNA-directed RNA polymerase specialized sigma subunit